MLVVSRALLAQGVGVAAALLRERYLQVVFPPHWFS